MLDRRLFLKSSGLALVAGGFLPGVFVRMAEAGTPPSRRVLVAIFQRGAVDGLNVLVPHGEKTYYAARPTIAVAAPRLRRQGGDRPRRILRTASVARAARSILPGPLGRLHPRRRQPRRDALALRRPGLHGVGHAGREVDRRRLPLARARGKPVREDLSPARGRHVRRDAPDPRRQLRRHRDDEPRQLRRARPGPGRGRRPILRVHVCGRGRRPSSGHGAGVVRGRADRALGRPVADRARQRRRLSARPARAIAPADRAAHQGRRRHGDRLHGRRRLGHARGRRGPARRAGCATSASRSPPSRRTSARGWPTSRS